MKEFNYETALNCLGVGKEKRLNDTFRLRVPDWVRGAGFIKYFLPYVKVIGDSREQDKWMENACKYYGIAFEWARKDDKSGTENLKEGDYTFAVVFGNKTYDYTGQVAFERKGSVSEFYSNCTGAKERSDRERVKREFNRFGAKGYRKVVLMLEFGERLVDLIDLKFEYRNHNGVIEKKNVGYTLYSTIMSWKQPNNADFDVIQSNNRERLFWLFLQECYYFFRNDLRIECEEKNLIEKENL